MGFLRFTTKGTVGTGCSLEVEEDEDSPFLISVQNPCFSLNKNFSLLETPFTVHTRLNIKHFNMACYKVVLKRFVMHWSILIINC
jgi:hypothetical protein